MPVCHVLGGYYYATQYLCSFSKLYVSTYLANGQVHSWYLYNTYSDLLLFVRYIYLFHLPSSLIIDFSPLVSEINQTKYPRSIAVVSAVVSFWYNVSISYRSRISNGQEMTTPAICNILVTYLLSSIQQ